MEAINSNHSIGRVRLEMKKFVLTLGGFAMVTASVTPFVGTVHAASTRYVETQHGWVSYHSGPASKDPVTGRLQLGQKAQLVKKANAWWYEIRVDGKIAYITTSSNYTRVVSGGRASGSSYVQTDHGWVAYHSGPGTNYAVIGRLQLGEKARLIRKCNRWWYEISVKGRTAYISASSDLVHVVGQSAVKTPGVNMTGRASAASGTWKQKADAVIRIAKTQVGVPYWWGHQVPGRGFDCSNFAEWAFQRALGMKFSTSSEYQRYHVGTPVSLSNIREGDLLFFKTANNPTGGGHVGIYMGNGQVIQEGGGWGKVTIESLHNTWLGRDLVCARRVIN